MATDTEAVLVPVWPEAGRRIGLGRTTTWELVRTGALDSVKVGRRRLVPVAAIAEFAKSLSATAS